MQGGLPVINNGCVAQFEADAVKQFIDPETGQIKTVFDTEQIEWTTLKHFECEGSFDTKIRIKCDGWRVSLDGNVGRFGRPDNVFGFSVLECIFMANRILGFMGLPPFTVAPGAPSKGDKYIATGAHITRVDLTRNYATGSYDNAVRYVHFLAGQDSGRRASAKQYGENGVSWNEGSKFWYSKMYIKAESLGQHALPELVDWVKEQGIVRHEISLKSRYLTQHGLRTINSWRGSRDIYIRGIEQTMENIIYGRFNDIIQRGTAIRTPLEEIQGNIGRIARDWRSGIDVWGDANYGQSTRRRWRKQLLQYGIDIKQPSNITRLNIKVNVIDLVPLAPPDWYTKEAA